MSKRLVAILIFLLGVWLISAFYHETKTCGDNICEAGESPFFCTQDCKTEAQPLNAIGKFTDMIEATDAYNIYLFNVLFKRDGGAYVREDVNVEVGIPKKYEVDADEFYELSSRDVPNIKVPYYADSIEGYDEIIYNYNSFYDVCWEYNCTSRVPPWQKITPVRKLFLSGSGDKYVKGVRVTNRLPPKGNVSIAVVFAYDGPLVPNETVSILKGNFMYVPEWYKEKADELFGNNDIINMSVTFFDTQVELPTELLPTSSICDFSEYIREQLPEVKGYDVLVQFYYATAKNDTYCFPHPVRTEYSSVFLFADPGRIDASYLRYHTTSLAHEIMHLFGANDRYTGEAEVSAGYKECCWLGSGYDIMCHRVAEYSGGFGCSHPQLRELTIDEVTAKEIGWWDMDGDGRIEVDDICPVDRDNSCYNK